MPCSGRYRSWRTGPPRSERVAADTRICWKAFRCSRTAEVRRFIVSSPASSAVTARVRLWLVPTERTAELARMLPRPTTATAIAAAAGASRSPSPRRTRPIWIGWSSCSRGAARSACVRPLESVRNSRHGGQCARCARSSTRSKVDNSPSSSMDAHCRARSQSPFIGRTVASTAAACGKLDLPRERPSYEGVPAVDEHPDHDQDEAERDEERRVADRLVLLFGSRPPQPSAAQNPEPRDRRTAGRLLRLHACRPAVAHEEPGDHQEAADAVEPQRDRAIEGRSHQQPEQCRTDERHRRAEEDEEDETAERREHERLGRELLRLPGLGLLRRAGTGAANLFGAHRPPLERVVAGGDVAVAERVERRVLDVAVTLDEPRAAWMEVAAARRIHGARNVALEHDRLALAADVRVRDRHC